MDALASRDRTPMTAKKFAALHVLVVDDEPLIRWSLAETLNEQGHQVVAAGDGCGAAAAIREASEPFDVVLLDYRLPDSDDLSLLASLRRLCPRAQLILMTAFGRPDIVRGAIELGAFRVINKPFELQYVADLVIRAHAAGVDTETH
jgi:DNA-binding NtrC family response regulator